LVAIIVFVTLAAAAIIAFYSSLIEATFLTLNPFSLSSAINEGSQRGVKALAIVNEKTKLVSVTTLLDTVASVVLTSSIGLILTDVFGPIGWVYTAIVGSLAIMILLYLLPKAIGIENSLRMAIRLAPSTHLLLDTLSPVAVPMTSLAKVLSEAIVGKPTYKTEDLADEFEDVVLMLERAGHIEPDAGRLLRAAVGSSRSTAADIFTPVEEIVSVSSDATVLDALKVMGRTSHPRIPVFNNAKKTFVGAVTFHSISKAIGRDLLNSGLLDYTIQPARAGKGDSLASIMQEMQDSGTTIAFVYDGAKMVGVITLSDLLERIIGIKV
jgi:CBS domain containing-hemolysin-like protein